MTSYVEKIRVPVRVGQAGMEPMDGYLSLGPQAEFHAGPETILERLNVVIRVVPFRRAEDERTLLLNRDEIEWVAAAPGVERELICPPNYQVTNQEHAVLRMMNGAILEGEVQMELPDHLNRASDFINGVEDFFPLMTPEGILLVSKLRVSCFELPAPSPRPPFAADRAEATAGR